MEDYSRFLIKTYAHWSVSVHQNQGYLGRCVVWCLRDDALDLADATPEEQKELFVVLNDLRKAATTLFRPDWFNYAFLGNETRHLHGHFLPRYASPREFAGMTFTDERWGRNYQTDGAFVTPPEVLEAVRLGLKEALG